MKRFLPQILTCAILTSSGLASGCLEAQQGHPTTAQTALVAADCMTGAAGEKVTICHATSSATNPYQTLAISKSACLNGHLGHAGDGLPDTAGNCCQPSALDCNGVCNGGAVLDCAGVCNGTAVADCAGVCNGTAVADCAGTCNGGAVADCAGTCNGGAVLEADVYFTTKGGVFRWSSDTGSVTTISSFPSYAIAISPSGQIFVGNGGEEAQASGVPDLVAPGIYTIDSAGIATPVSADPADAIAAEDLQFDPNGVLHAANSGGIYSIAANGTSAQVSTNPTSQFAFESATSVVTTNGTAYQTPFGRGTDRIDLNTDTSTSLNSDGGEDIHVGPAGKILLCGKGGLFELLPSGALAKLNGGRAVFNFGVTSWGDVYFGNTALYGPTLTWPQGLFRLAAGFGTATIGTQVDTSDINAMVLEERCEVPSP